jgi:two-component system cell cycle response regulator
VNDGEGHPAGDRVLREFAQRMQGAIRSGDLVGRWGGEEFIVVAPRTDIVGAVALAERIRTSIADHPVDVGGHSIAVTVSVGCAVGAGTAEALIERADAALYRSKAEGRNRVTAAQAEPGNLPAAH